MIFVEICCARIHVIYFVCFSFFIDRDWRLRTMTTNEKRVAEREALRSVIQQWNANRLDLFELSEPDEASVIRFQFKTIDEFCSFPANC